MGKENRIDKYIAENELPDFLRQLADALEKGGEGEFVCVEDYKKFKLSAKKEFGQISIKAKFKADKPCEVETGTGEAVKPKYKYLKKRMKSSFKMLIKMAHDGELPPAEAVESFMEDSRLMVTYPGYGDEYYDEYIKVCEAFHKAYKAGDVESVRQNVDRLALLKGQCHAKYD